MEQNNQNQEYVSLVIVIQFFDYLMDFTFLKKRFF